MNPEELILLRELIERCAWKASTSARYRTAPHSYIVQERSGDEWKSMSEAIDKFSTECGWRGHRFKYMVLDGQCYWQMGNIINKASESTLEPE